jgi:hypothetical protein
VKRLVLCAALAGCFSMGGGVQGAMMTPQIVQTSGTHTFNAPFEKVFQATQAALASEGFPIAIAKPETGFIKTGQKLIRSEAIGGGGAAMATDITRQYILTVHQAGASTSVSAEPRIFQGNAELTGQAIWDLDSPQGEKALWTRLFRDIQEAL